MIIVFKVRCYDARVFLFEMDDNTTIDQLKNAIFERSGIRQEYQIMHIRGKPIRAGCLSQYELSGNMIIMCDRNKGGAASARLLKELNEVATDPPAFCTAGPIADDMFNWEAMISGPPDSPYAGGTFRLSVKFPSNYPSSPPNVSFITRIYHPNVNTSGRICLKSISSVWNADMSIWLVLHSIYSMMEFPNEDNPEPDRKDVAFLYKHNRDVYNRNARDETQRYAKGI